MDTGLLIEIVALLALTGAVAGFFAGMLGIGGGGIVVPAFYYMMTLMMDVSDDVAMKVAVGTALAMIVPTGLSSAYAHYKRGGVDVSLLKCWLPGIILGVVLGGFFVRVVDGGTIKLIFACLLSAIALYMLASPKVRPVWQSLPSFKMMLPVGGVIGLLSSLIGIGGATMTVPFMTLCNIEMRKAVGTAAGIGLGIAIPGVIVFTLAGWGQVSGLPYSFGYINLLAFSVIAAVSVFAAPLGVKAAHSLPVPLLRKIFAIFMLSVTSRMFWDFVG